jgi:hypothetical protein
MFPLSKILSGGILVCIVIQQSLVTSFSPRSFNIRITRGHNVECSITGRNFYDAVGKIFMSADKSNNDEGIVELIDKPVSKEPTKISNNAPFMSQGEISPEALNPDFSDPRQTRAVIYTVISLLPVLFLIPLMIGSRDFIPPDSLPPVQM